ncbi:hypothetical protein Tco_0846126, partial [Tanacetum coccineum]
LDDDAYDDVSVRVSNGGSNDDDDSSEEEEEEDDSIGVNII